MFHSLNVQFNYVYVLNHKEKTLNVVTTDSPPFSDYNNIQAKLIIFVLCIFVSISHTAIQHAVSLEVYFILFY